MTAIDLAAKQGAKFDCEVVGIVAGRLARSDRAKAGRQLWRQACDRTTNALLSNSAFETDPSTTSFSPFTWQLRSEGGLDVAVGVAPAPLRGHALKIRPSKNTSELQSLMRISYAVFCLKKKTKQNTKRTHIHTK